MTTLTCTSSPAALVLALTALDGEERTPGSLLVANEAAAPEVVPDWWPGLPGLTGRFTAVVSWNDLIAPLHPTAWLPAPEAAPMFARLVLGRLHLDAPPDHLVLDSLTAGPGRVLVAAFPDAAVTVVTASPLAYGPTAAHLGSDVLERVERHWFVDSIPGLTPLLLADGPVPPRPVAADAYRAALADALPAPTVTGAVLLGEDWAGRGALAPAAERAMHLDAITRLVAAGHRTITFAPHHAAGPATWTGLVAAAGRLGATLTVGPPATAHEAYLAATPDLVVGTAAAALFLASRAATIATRAVLDALTPYEHPDRIPVTLADVTLPRLDGTRTPDVDLHLLVDTVAYCMRHTLQPDLRARAQTWLAGHRDPKPYLRKKRLESLGLVATPAARAEPAPKAGATAVLRAAERLKARLRR